jgi:hypothetical protein
MKFLSADRIGAALVTAAALVVSGGVSASAQAIPLARPGPQAVVTNSSNVTVDFKCPSPTVCLYLNQNYTGTWSTHVGTPVLATNDGPGGWGGAWSTFYLATGSGPNPGSLNDNSDSVMWIAAKDTTPITYQCLHPGKWDLYNGWGWFYIMYGVTSCPKNPPPGL